MEVDEEPKGKQAAQKGIIDSIKMENDILPGQKGKNKKNADEDEEEDEPKAKGKPSNDRLLTT